MVTNFTPEESGSRSRQSDSQQREAVEPFQYVKKEWIVSTGARRLYRAAAAISMAVYPLLLALIYDGPLPFLKQLLFIAVLATALNGMAMEFFRFRFDESQAWKQIFWFCALIFIPIGPALYCLLVYSRSQVLRTACSLDETIVGASKHL